MDNNLKNYFIFSFLTVFLSAVSFCVHAEVLITGGYDWNLNFTDPINTTSYVIADYKDDGSNDNRTNGLANNSWGALPQGTTGTDTQRFDAEEMYLDVSNDTLYIAIVTGLPSLDEDYAAGDILFDLNGDMTDAGGVPINSNSFTLGASAGNKTSQVIIEQNVPSDSNGYEYGLTTKTHAPQLNWAGGAKYDFGYSANAGDIFSLSEWNSGSDIVNTLNPASGRVVDGTAVTASTTSIIYGDRIGVASRYVIEASIDLNNSGSFGADLLSSVTNGGVINVHWNPLNNRDWLQFTGALIDDPVAVVPEPKSLLLIALGLTILFINRRYLKTDLRI